MLDSSAHTCMDVCLKSHVMICINCVPDS